MADRVDPIVREAHSFLYNRSEEEKFKRSKEKSRDALKKYLLEFGEEDESGHRRLDFESDMTIVDKSYSGVMAQRRLTASIDTDSVEEDLKRLGPEFYDRVFKPKIVREFDENELYVLNQEGIVPDAKLDSWITEQVTYAIVPVKS